MSINNVFPVILDLYWIALEQIQWSPQTHLQNGANFEPKQLF